MNSEAQVITPRVTKQFLPSYVGQKVRFVGNVANYNHQQNVLVLQGADNQETHIHASPETANLNGAVEIYGSVNPDGTIREISHVHFEKFDLINYEQLVNLMHSNYRNLFM